jgi:hypothetical protein
MSRAAASVGAGPGCTITTTEAERLSGRLRLRHGRTARRTHPAGRFRDGAVSARFVVPHGAGGRLTLGVGARGYRATITRVAGNGTLLAIRRASRAVSSSHLGLRLRPGARVALALRLSGRTLQAKAWPAARRQPGWQLRTSHWQADRGSGRARVSARLVGGRAVVRFSRVQVRTTRVRGSIGVYNGMFSWDRTRALFGRYPMAETSYYQPDQRVIVDRERARIRRGISPVITITTKGTRLIEALGSGPRHPRFRRAERWLDRYVARLARIASRDVDVPVYATVEHEFKFKVRIGEVTGRSASPRLYGAMLRRFYAKARAADPDIRVTYWMVADDSDRGLEARVARQFRTPPDAILFDPYGSTSGDTITSVTNGDLRWIRRQRWYVGQEIALGEFGMRVSAGDDALADFHSGLHTDLRGQGISWGVFFNRSRDFDTQIAGRSDRRTFPDAVAAFRASLAASSRC